MIVETIPIGNANHRDQTDDEQHRQWRIKRENHQYQADIQPDAHQQEEAPTIEASLLIHKVTRSQPTYSTQNKKNPFPVIQSSVQMYLSRAIYFQPLNEDIRERAKVLEIEGIKPIDALHVASFEASQSNFFLTCDKRLLNRCQALSISALNPIDLIKELDDEN